VGVPERRRRQRGVLEERVLAGGAALGRAAEEEQVLEPPLPAAAAAAAATYHGGGSGRRRRGLVVDVVSGGGVQATAAPERGQRPRGPPAPAPRRRRRRSGGGGGPAARPASLQRRRLRLTIRAAGSPRGAPSAIGGAGGGVVGDPQNARVRRVQRPNPAALEELVGGREGRRGLLQLPAEPEREVERAGLVATRRRRRGVAVAARPGRARRGAGEEVAVGREVVAAGHGRGSWAARCAWRHDRHRHHHLHLESSNASLLASCSSCSLSLSLYHVDPLKGLGILLLLSEVLVWEVLGWCPGGREREEGTTPAEEGRRKLGRIRVEKWRR
jgi:hypothetical protein